MAANITKGKAGFLLGGIFANPCNREKWGKYLFLTKDTGQETDELKPFFVDELERLELPSGWEKQASRTNNGGRELGAEDEALAASIWAESSPFDEPEPEVQFQGKHFCFTGEFRFGRRRECRASTEQLGGIFDSDVKASTDYLVIGSLGSEHFAKDGYGRKIEWAIVSRSKNGSPLLISEDHWTQAVKASSAQ